jgi:hypothetical protein
MDELLKVAMGNILKTSQLSDSQKVEVMGAIHTLYSYIDILEFED